MPDSDFWILDSQKFTVRQGATAGVFITFGGPAGPWTLPSGRGSATLANGHRFVNGPAFMSREPNQADRCGGVLCCTPVRRPKYSLHGASAGTKPELHRVPGSNGPANRPTFQKQRDSLP